VGLVLKLDPDTAGDESKPSNRFAKRTNLIAGGNAIGNDNQMITRVGTLPALSKSFGLATRCTVTA
jgi:hypothetical protein